MITFQKGLNRRNNIFLLAIFLLLLFIVFWVLIRPSQIQKECYQVAMKPTYSLKEGKYQRDGGERFSDEAYEECLKKKGL